MTDMLARFVDAPSLTATVRLDLMASPAFIDGGSWDDAPGPLLGDPEGSGSEYGRRKVTFRWVIEGTFAQAKAARTNLAREILRDSNWLMFQQTPTSSVCWFQLYRTSPGPLDITAVDVDSESKSEWSIQVTLEAEPYLLGEMVSFSRTIPNDPAAPGVAASFSVTGDAPTPLSVSFSTLRQWEMDFSLSAMSAWSGRMRWQAQSGTLGANATVVADSEASGGQAVSVDMTAAAGDALRLTFSPTILQAGTYRLMARMRPMATTSSVQVRGAGASAIRGATRTIAGTGYRWVDLGEYAFPLRNQPLTAPYTIAPGDVRIWAARVSSAPTLRIDSFVAVPVSTFEDVAPSRRQVWEGPLAAGSVLIDGEQERLSLTSSGVLGDGVLSSPRGVFIKAVPGATNVLHLFSQKWLGGYPDDPLDGQQILNFTYYPRYLWVP